MAYSDPQSTHNPATGGVPPASWGDAVRDGIVWLAGDAASGGPKPMTTAYNSAAQSIATATATALTMDSERYDVGGCHSTSSNTSRLTVPSGAGGVYAIGASVKWTNSSTSGFRQLALRLNGATTIAVIEGDGTTNETALTISKDYKLSATDYVEAVVYQTSGGLLSTGSTGTEVWWHWVGVG